MRSAEVVVYETECVLADLLRPSADARGWWLREVRDHDSCVALLQQAWQGVVVLSIDRGSVEALTLLHRVRRECPATACIVASAAHNPALTLLAWDLGAAYVLCPPQPLALLPDVVAGLMGPPATPSSGEPHPDE